MKFRKSLLPVNLQFFAEPEDGGGGGTPPADPPTPPAEPPKEPKEPKEPGKSFTRDDVAKMLSAERAKWQKEQEEKEAEAQKLAKMNAEEKAKHEKQKLMDKIAEFERKESLSAMSKEASKMFIEAELPADEGILQLVTVEDAEVTKANVKAVLDFAAAIKKASVRQPTPGEGGKFSAEDGKTESVAEMAKKSRIIK